MTRTREVLVWLGGVALAIASHGGGFAAEPAHTGDRAPSDSAASAGAEPGNAGAVAQAAPVPAAVRENPSAGPASGSTGTSPLPPAAGYVQGPRVYATPVPVLPPAPINPRVVELTQKYSDLDREILGLVEKGRKTQDAAEKAGLRKQIQESVARQFDLRQEARELELERLRKQLAEVEQTIGRHKGLKEKVVEHRVTELLDENAELKWEPLAGAPGGVRAVQETVVELEQVLPDGTRVKVPTTVVRVLPEGQIPVPPSSGYLPPAGPTRTPPLAPATTAYGGGMMPAGSPMMGSGTGTTGPVAVDQLPTERAGMSPLDVPAGRLALRQAARRLAVSEQELEKTKELLKTAAVSMAEVDARVFTVELNKMALERAIQEYDAHTKLLELDLREAEVELQAAEQGVKQAPARPQAEIEVQKAGLRLERARTMLDLHTRETSQGADGATVAEQAQERRLPMNNLKQIGLAMHNYHDALREFPPAYRADTSGRPLLSWRVLILPYLEQEALYRQFHLDEPWDSEHNKKLSETVVPVYRSPGSKAASGMTNYLTVRGPNTVFPGKDAVHFQDITDGTANTILVVEASDQKAVVWTKPDDFEYDESDPLAGLVGLRSAGFLAALCDGSALLIPSSVEKETLRRLFLRNDGKPIPSPIGKAD